MAGSHPSGRRSRRQPSDRPASSLQPRRSRGKRRGSQGRSAKRLMPSSESANLGQSSTARQQRRPRKPITPSSATRRVVQRNVGCDPPRLMPELLPDTNSRILMLIRYLVSMEMNLIAVDSTALNSVLMAPIVVPKDSGRLIIPIPPDVKSLIRRNVTVCGRPWI